MLEIQQLQRYNEERKGLKGNTEFLYEDSLDYKTLVHKSIYNQYLDVNVFREVSPKSYRFTI